MYAELSKGNARRYDDIVRASFDRRALNEESYPCVGLLGVKTTRSGMQSVPLAYAGICSHTGGIYAVCVAPEARGHGLGSIIAMHAALTSFDILRKRWNHEKTWRREGDRMMSKDPDTFRPWLMVESENKPAIAAYVKAGFVFQPYTGRGERFSEDDVYVMPRENVDTLAERLTLALANV